MLDLAPAGLNPFESNRLLQELAKYYAETKKWGDEARRVRQTSTQLIIGGASGTLWLKEPDVGGGIAIWDKIPGGGLRVWDLHLGGDDLRQEILYELVHGLVEAADAKEGLFAVSDTIVGFSSDDLRALLGPMGFVHVPRLLYSHPTGASSPPSPPRGRRVPLGVDQLDRIVRLESKSPPDGKSHLFSAHPFPTPEEIRQDLTDLFLDVDGTGHSPHHTPWGCFGVEDGLEIVASVLSREDPLAPKERGWIHALSVDPAFRESGLDTYLLSAYLSEAKSNGLTEASVELVPDDPWIPRVERFGFHRVPGPDGDLKGFWVHEAKARSLHWM